MSGEASGQNPTEIRYDTDDSALRDTADAQTALAAILRSQSDQLLVHDLAVRLGLPDAVHQLRVSCRSLRALLEAAAPFLERSRTDDLDLRLRDFARNCAPARDFEVIAELLAESIELLDGTLQSEALEQLQGRALVQFTAAARNVRRDLNRKEHLRLLADMQVFVSSPPYTDRVTGLSSRQLASKLLRRSLRRLQRIAAQSWESRDTLPAEEAALHHAHDVRKAVKRVRYVASMLDAAQVRPQKRLRKAAKDARRYQRELGDLMDSAILLEWLSRTAVDLDGEADRYAVGLLRGATATRVSQALRHAEVLIHELREQRVKS